MGLLQVLPQTPSFGELPPTLIGLLIGVVMFTMSAASMITLLIVRNLLHEWRLDRQSADEQRKETTKALREVAIYMGTVNQTLTTMQRDLLPPLIEMARERRETRSS